MSAITRGCAVVVLACVLAACASAPVRFDTGSAAALPGRDEPGREISAQACGFQLLLFIPLGVNSRQERAWQSMREQAGGKPIVDVEVEEGWTYGFVGTGYCTRMRGRVLGG